ncbi:MAG: hypothetical protein GY940_31510 [bacterium]|nr:hypothetical protein [bacterium]
MKRIFVLALAVVFLSLSLATPLISQDCIIYAFYGQKDNKLHLYFPTAQDATFPEWGIPYGINTSPLADFDVADLATGIGTTADLRQKIFEVVTEDYCEFNVGVSMHTTAPVTSGSYWQIVGIGSDSETIGAGILFGIAQDVDLGDNDPEDYARVYADSFGLAYTAAGGALAGANSTLDRWANAIASTVTHEAAHNYGVGHPDAYPVGGSGEDGVNNHILATGSSGLTGAMRAGVDRHFSDTAYEILGHNVGLHVNTVHNWDFNNPNNVTAYAMEFKVLSTSSTLTVSWSYSGNRAPWINPTVTATGTTEVFHGTTYNVYYVTYSTGQTWLNGPSGEVPAGVDFHLGASFIETNAVVVTESTLLDSGSSPLPLSPRMAGYDNGALDLESGDLEMRVFNPNPALGNLVLRNISVQLVPRMIDINTMMDGMEPMGLRKMPINVISSFNLADEVTIKDSSLKLRVANLKDQRHLDKTYTKENCEQGYVKSALDITGGEVNYCPEGTALSLFPSTYVYVILTVEDPNARYWDVQSKQFKVGPRQSKIFYQFAGIMPDTNDNGEDDLLDIRNGTSKDENNNGVPDEAEREGRNESPNEGKGEPMALNPGTDRSAEHLIDLFKAGFTPFGLL